MSGALWWFALPVLLLPIWWHRQKRRRTQAEMLATARFLPAAPPLQMRIWRFDDAPLLLLRCLLLVALIAWLAAVALPWRGDTVFVGQDAPAAWVDEQTRQAGMSGAQRVPLPDDVLSWLQAHEHAWRKNARLLVLAAKVALPAQMPTLAHAVDLRIAPPAALHASLAPRASAGPAQAAAPAAYSVALVAPAERQAAWHALFAAFDAAGGGSVRHVVTESDGLEAPPAAALIVWDRATAPPANWRAPLWWLPKAALPLVLGADQNTLHTLRAGGLELQVADSPRGRLWISDAWPPGDADGARVLYETWHALHFAPEAWPMPAQALPARRALPLATADTRPDTWLAYALLALFLLERWMTHVRRR